MNQTIVQAERNTAAVEKILRELSEIPAHHYLTLGDDDPFYEEPTPVRVRPASDFADVAEIAAKVGKPNAYFYAADVFDLTGRKVPISERPAEWWAEQRKVTPTSVIFYETNAVHRLGHDYLMVGRGRWYVIAETRVDGQRAFETISDDEQTRRDLAELELLMPAVHAAKPEWADEPTIRSIDNDTDADTIAVTYSRGGFLPDGFTWDAEVSIEQYVVISRQTGAVVRVDTLTPTLYVGEPRVIGDEAGMRPDQLRALAEAVRNMADALEPILAVN